MPNARDADTGEGDAQPSAAHELTELGRPRTRHLQSSFSTQLITSGTIGDSLPYLDLGGLGFERLVFLILLADGHLPRYFGRSGQPQFGIDLLTTVGETQQVYQCKNTRTMPPAALREALALFEQRWLSRDDLPRPSSFVLCCSADLRHHEEAWSVAAEAFRRRTGVTASLWERSVLDERLRHLPDVVADVFSDTIAHRFCEHEPWQWDLFQPLRAGTGSAPIERFLQLREDDLLEVPAALQSQFDTILAREGVALVRGAAGSGKTTTGLALSRASSSSLSSQIDRRWRIYYLDLAHDWNEGDVVRAVAQRLSQPTLFVFDDAHLCLDRLPSLHRRLDALLADRTGTSATGATARLYLMRHTPTPTGLLRDSSEFERRFEARKAVLDLQPTLEWLRRWVARHEPSWPALEDAHLERLFTVCAGDLSLASQILETIDTPAALHHLDLQTLYPELLRRFCGRLPVDLPAVRTVAGLGQFEIHPPLDFQRDRLRTELAELNVDLISRAGRPPRWVFFHPSGAELMFRALCWHDGVDSPLQLMVDSLLAYLENSPAPWQDLLRVVQSELRLTSEDELHTLRQRLVSHPRWLERLVQAISLRAASSQAQHGAPPLRLLAHALRLAPDTYSEHLAALVPDILEHMTAAPVWELPFLARAIIDVDPASGQQLRQQLGRQLRQQLGQHLLEHDLRAPTLVEPKRTSVAHLSYLLAYFGQDSPVWRQAVASIPEPAIEALLAETLDQEGACGWMVQASTALHNAHPQLAEALWQRLGAAFFRAVFFQPHQQTHPSNQLQRRHSGTIVDLIRWARFAPSSLLEGLLEQTTHEDLDLLVHSTIEQRRSIGTLDLALRELSEKQRQILESHVTPYSWWRLLGSSGDLNLLAGLSRRLSHPYRQRVLEAALEAASANTKVMASIRQGLFERSTLPQLGHYLRRHSYALPYLAPPAALPQVQRLLESMIERTDWQDVRYGHHLISSAPDSPIRQACLEPIRARLSHAASTRHPLPDLAQAVSFLRLLQHLLPEQLPELRPHLEAIVPAPATWLRDRIDGSQTRTLRHLRGLFHLLSHEGTPPSLVEAASDLAFSPQVAALCREVDALETLLYSWSALTLQCARRPDDGSREIGEAVSAEFRAVVHDRVAHPPIDENELDHWVALVGLTAFLGWTDRESWTGRLKWTEPLPPVEQIETRLEEKGFVTGGFYLLGLQYLLEQHLLEQHLLEPERTSLAPEHWRTVSRKVESFERTSRAVELLLHQLQQHEAPPAAST